jgi:hypothetical protein
MVRERHPDLREVADLARKIGALRAHAGRLPGVGGNSDAAVRDTRSRTHRRGVSHASNHDADRLAATSTATLSATTEYPMSETYPMSDLKVAGHPAEGPGTSADVAATLTRTQARGRDHRRTDRRRLLIKPKCSNQSRRPRAADTLLAEERSASTPPRSQPPTRFPRGQHRLQGDLVSDWQLAKTASPTSWRRRLRRRSAGSAQRNPQLVVPIIAAAALQVPRLAHTATSWPLRWRRSKPEKPSG